MAEYDRPTVTKRGEEPLNTAQSGGLVLMAGIGPQHTPARRIWFGKASNAPGFRSLPHHHGEAETGSYVLSGRARVFFGENYREYVDPSEGDFMFVPPFLPHLEVNMSTSEELWWLACRTPDNIVVNPAGYRRLLAGRLPPRLSRSSTARVGADIDTARSTSLSSTIRECGGNIMAKAYFMVRSVVTEALREKFDHWYSTDHLPWALREFKAEKAWRFWSARETGVHYALYQFVDLPRLDAALASEGFKQLVADFDRAFPAGVTRTRDVLSMVEERAASQ